MLMGCSPLFLAHLTLLSCVPFIHFCLSLSRDFYDLNASDGCVRSARAKRAIADTRARPSVCAQVGHWCGM